MRVTLIDTCTPAARGSMRRYRELALRACRIVAPDTEVQTVSATLPAWAAGIAPAPVATWLNHAWAAAACRRIARQRGDVYHLIDGSYAHLLRWLPARRTVVTVHDLIPWLQTQGHFHGIPAPSPFARRLITAGLHRLPTAGVLVSVSEATRRDLTAAGVPPARVEVVHSALDRTLWSCAQPPASDCRRSPMLLHVGHSGFYKNRLTALRVLAVLSMESDVRLTLAGSPLTRTESRTLARAGLSSRVDVVTRLDDGALARLYRTASLLLFPSLYEGFGWPPLEAMACGCPVVCSNAASLPEVVGTAAMTAAPTDVHTLATHCRRILNEPALADRLRTGGWRNVERFSLRKMGEGLLNAYRAARSRDGEKPA